MQSKKFCILFLLAKSFSISYELSCMKCKPLFSRKNHTLLSLGDNSHGLVEKKKKKYHSFVVSSICPESAGTSKESGVGTGWPGVQIVSWVSES